MFRMLKSSFHAFSSATYGVHCTTFHVCVGFTLTTISLKKLAKYPRSGRGVKAADRVILHLHAGSILLLLNTPMTRKGKLPMSTYLPADSCLWENRVLYYGLACVTPGQSASHVPPRKDAGSEANHALGKFSTFRPL